MPTPQHGKATTVLVDQYPLTSYFKSGSVKRTKKADESTVFGLDDRTYAPGLQDGSMSFGGLYSAGVAGDVDAVLRAALGDSTNGQIVTVGFGGMTIGNRVAMCLARQTSYSVDMSNDALIPVSAEVMPNGGVDQGVSLHSHAASEAASTNSSSVNHGGSTTKGAVAHLHVTALSGTDTPTLTAKVQHSTDNSSWADLITFTNATAVGSQRSVVATATTINQYTRCASTITGTNPTFTYALAFARRFDVDVASLSFEYYPKGETGGYPKHTGECLPTSYSIDFNNDGLITCSAEFQVSGAVTDTTA
jgi:hypothetical protein